MRHSLYLLFNEGYKASSGDQLVRKDVCEEAIRLTDLLIRHRVGNQPDTHALLAMMLFNAARLDARVDDTGGLVRLEEQDRSRWDQRQIARGMFHLMQSAAGTRLGRYHLQSAIAAEHCRAAQYQETDWPTILGYYDQLVALDDSPIACLNRAVAVGRVHGARAGIDAVKQLKRTRSLEQYHLYHAVLGEFELEAGAPAAAAAHFERAIERADLHAEKAFLRKRSAACTLPPVPQETGFPDGKKSPVRS